MSKLNLYFITEGDFWSVVAVDDHGKQSQIQDHIFIVISQPMFVTGVGVVLYLTDTLVSQGMHNLLCVKLHNAQLPPATGTYPINIVNEDGFKYPDTIGVVRLEPNEQMQLSSIFRPTMQLQPPMPSQAVLYQQEPMLLIPANTLGQYKDILVKQVAEIQRLTAENQVLEQQIQKNQKSIASQPQSIESLSPPLSSEHEEMLIKPTLQSPSPPIETSQIKEAPKPTQLPQHQEVKAMPDSKQTMRFENPEIKVSVAEDLFKEELASSITFWGNTNYAEQFYADLVKIFTANPDATPNFLEHKLSLGLCLKLAVMNVDFDVPLNEKLYRAIFIKLATLLNEKAIQDALTILDTVNSWEQIKRNLVLLHVGNPASSTIKLFCDFRIADLKLLQNKKPILTMLSPSITKANTKVVAATPIVLATDLNAKRKNKKKKRPVNATLQDDDDDDIDAILKDQAYVDAQKALAEANQPAQVKFASFERVLAGKNDDDIIALLPKLAMDPRVLVCKNAQGENLLLIAFRNIKDRIRLVRTSAKKGAKSEPVLAPVSAAYIALMDFMFAHPDADKLLKGTANKSVLDYLAENTDKLPDAMRLSIWEKFLADYLLKVTDQFADDLQLYAANDDDQAVRYNGILRLLHSGAGDDGPTFLHILLENPNNLSLVLALLDKVLRIESFDEEEILSKVETPLLIAKHNGVNLRGRIEEQYLSILKKRNRDEAKDREFVTLLVILNNYFIKVAAHLPALRLENLVEMEDFFNLTADNNLIIRLVDDAFNPNGTINFQALEWLGLILIERANQYAIRRNVQLKNRNVYAAFMSDDIANTLLALLQRGPQALASMQDFMEKWLKIEELSMPEQNMKGRLLQQLILLGSRYNIDHEEDELGPLIRLLDIAQAMDPRCKKIWIDCTMGSLVACLLGHSDLEHAATLNWSQICSNKIKCPNVDFSSDLDSANQDVDSDGNNVMHRAFILVNTHVLEDLSNNDENSAETKSFAKAVDHFLAVVEECQPLQDHLKGLLNAKNNAGLYPIDVLTSGVAVHANPVAKDIMEHLHSSLVRQFQLLSPSALASPRLRLQ